MYYDLSGSGHVFLRPAAVYDPAADRMLKDTVIEVENGRIVRLLPASRCPGGAVVELPDMTLLPGLMDAHVHLCLRGETGEMDRIPELSRQQLKAVMEENLAKNLRLGITTIRDLACPEEMMELVAEDTSGAAAPCVVASGPGITIPRGHGYYFGIPLEEEREAEPTVERICAMGADCIKIMGTGGNSTPGTNVDACQFPDEFFDHLVHSAHEKGKKVACHAHGLAGVWQCIHSGVDSVEHGSYMDDEALDALAASGIFYIATTCPGKLLSDLSPAAADRVCRRHRLIRRGAEIGVRFGAGTDAGIPGVPHGSLVHEIQELARLGLGAKRSLRAATADNAELLGLADRGRIAPGCVADFVAYRGDVTRDLTLLETPAFVMRAGVPYEI